MPFRLAVVDDDSRFRDLAVILLRARGFEVVSADRDMAGALESIPRLRPDGALIDYHLPDGDGLQLTRLLHRLGVPTVFVLTSTDPDAIPDRADDGADVRAFISKDRLAAADLRHLFLPSGERG